MDPRCKIVYQNQQYFYIVITNNFIYNEKNHKLLRDKFIKICATPVYGKLQILDELNLRNINTNKWKDLPCL